MVKNYKQSQHVRKVNTNKGKKKIIVNKGYIKKSVKRKYNSNKIVPEKYKINRSGKNIYTFLNVSPLESSNVVLAKIKSLSKYWHPDISTGDGEVMNRLNEAKEVFSDPWRRLAYEEKSKVFKSDDVLIPISSVLNNYEDDISDQFNMLDNSSDSDFQEVLDLKDLERGFENRIKERSEANLEGYKKRGDFIELPDKYLDIKDNVPEDDELLKLE